jgi:hypothetical protein
MIRIILTNLLFILAYNIYAEDSTSFAIHSKTSHVLYMNCANSITITLQCNNAFSKKTITFSATNATVKIDTSINNTFSLTIIPDESSNKLTLNAYDNMRLLGVEIFNVKNLPSPEIQIKAGGKQIDVKNGLYHLPNEISIEAEMKYDVQNITSIAAQYIVTDFEITFIKDGTVLEKKHIKNNSIDLRNIKQIESTEYIVISINEIKIVTPGGNLKKIPYENTIITLPINK